MSVAVAAAVTAVSVSSKLLVFRVRCSDSNPRRGFGPKKEYKGPELPQRNSSAKQSVSMPRKAPGLSSQFEGKYGKSVDIDFEERLEAIKRSALEQKRADEIKEFGPIDYDASIESEKKAIGLGTKIGVGIAVVVFGLVFALGDFLPSGSDNPTEDTAVVKNKLSEEEKVTLQKRLKEFEATLSSSPKDQAAVEGAAVTLAELGEYPRAASLLEELAKERQNDPEVLRLLGEVKLELKDYEGSIAAYKSSAMASTDIDFEVTRGLTNALLAAKKPDEAVKFLLDTRERLNAAKKTSVIENKVDSAAAASTEAESSIDPIQVELLLGKAYSDWGHVSDAVAVYDRLIADHPEDFRGYLAKGIILKENGNTGDAERMFIQARFFAPDNAKPLVDRFSKTLTRKG
ncbi:PREDICTED: uncharacterized protein LOC104812331 [Tarenaya hassleriana]|uniref:uncharacterized protein LOC104812331 n=1 Tax=Tarenaya hassleriana TaxID=28532 RepID=UPI00053C68EE|nr:PREDICTED: uncharacterized protein LOC104812331 [Tarenaya hassleriana]